MRLLLQAGADIEKVDEDGYAPLAAAAEQEYFPAMQLLLQARAHADVVCPTEGKTALCLAAERGDFRVVHLLLSCGADVDMISQRATGTRSRPLFPSSYWLKTQLFNFWASYKVVYSESFNFYFLVFWASRSFGGL